MASVKVKVSPEILNWILRLSGSHAADLDAERQARLDDWKTGRKEPTLSQISDMSRKLRVPFGYFFLNEPFDDTPEVFAHRTIGSLRPSQASRELTDTVSDMELIQDWMIEEMRRQGEDSLDYVGSLTSAATAEQIAAKIRSTLTVSANWYEDKSDTHVAFDYLREKMERVGVIVMMNGIVGNNNHRKLDSQEFRAFALVDRTAPLIFINRNDESAPARLFSLLHEFVHILMGTDELYNAPQQSEQEVSRLEVACNRGASEFLMPDADFTRIWKAAGADGVEKTFPVSRMTVALRALNHGYITQEEYDREADEAVRRIKQLQQTNRAKGGNYYSTQSSRIDRRFFQALSASVASGTTTSTEAYRLTGTNRFTFDKILENQ